MARHLALGRDPDLHVAVARLELQAVEGPLGRRLVQIRVVEPITVCLGILRSGPGSRHGFGQVGAAHTGLGIQPRRAAVEEEFTLHAAVENLDLRPL